jgi:hypothetical protein
MAHSCDRNEHVTVCEWTDTLVCVEWYHVCVIMLRGMLFCSSLISASHTWTDAPTLSSFLTPHSSSCPWDLKWFFLEWGEYCWCAVTLLRAVLFWQERELRCTSMSSSVLLLCTFYWHGQTVVIMFRFAFAFLFKAPRFRVLYLYLFKVHFIDSCAVLL